jgi:hypothetical protein
VRLLAWQFSKPVIIANLIAWPIAWYVMDDWLKTFDVRVDLGATPFVAAGALALLIAIGTIAGHALRVARANPILAFATNRYDGHASLTLWAATALAITASCASPGLRAGAAG